MYHATKRRTESGARRVKQETVLSLDEAIQHLDSEGLSPSHIEGLLVTHLQYSHALHHGRDGAQLFGLRNGSFLLISYSWE